jgi:hypothetical protein
VPYQGAVYTIRIDMRAPRALHELVVWNYNSSLEGTYRGAKRMLVALDGQRASPPAGHLIRKGPGPVLVPYGQVCPWSHCCRARGAIALPESHCLGRGAGARPRSACGRPHAARGARPQALPLQRVGEGGGLERIGTPQIAYRPSPLVGQAEPPPPPSPPVLTGHVSSLAPY